MINYYKCIFLFFVCFFNISWAQENESHNSNLIETIKYFLSLDEETKDQLMYKSSPTPPPKAPIMSLKEEISNQKINSQLIEDSSSLVAADHKLNKVNLNASIRNGNLLNNTIKSANNSVGVHFINKYVDYMETSNGINLDSETGWASGYSLSASLMKDLFFGNDYFQAQFSRIDDKTRYTGAYWGGSYGDLVMNNGAKINDYSFRYGKGFDIANNFMLTPYFEFGKHRWDRILPPDSNPSMERYYFHYYGLGALAQGAISDKLVITANAMLGRTVQPRIFVNTPGDSSTLEQGTSFIDKLGIDFDYALSPKIHANLGLESVHFKYGISNSSPSGVYLEPDSKTNYKTINLGLSYHY